MVRPASLWGTLSGILDVSAKMGILQGHFSMGLAP